MDQEALRKAQQASRAAYLRKEAQRQEKAAAVVLEEKLREVEQGLVPATLTEAEFLLKRSEEVQAAGGLLQAARHRQQLAGEDPLGFAKEGKGDEYYYSQNRMPSGVDGIVEENLQVRTASSSAPHAQGTIASTVTAPNDIAVVGKEEAEDGGYVRMRKDIIDERVEKKDYVADKTLEELQQVKAAALLSRHEQLQQQRRSLPIYKVREELTSLIRDNQVVVIVGETGSGKTTQLLQYLYEDGIHIRRKKVTVAGSAGEGATQSTGDVAALPLESAGASADQKQGAQEREEEEDELRLICTQPRRIAAVSVAERVAQEVGCRCGSVVGYKVRFDDKSGPLTRILFVTDGMMLKEFTGDPDLSTVAAIMVDEAHERSLNTDILLGLLRDITRRNPHLKVIVASATINAEKFSSFFSGAPIFTVTGRTFPVDVFYAEEPVADYITEAAQTVIGLHMSKPLPGDVLVFLPGQDAIESCAETLRQYVAEAQGEMRPLLILPIYSSLPPKEQARIYEATPPGTRKVVIATNIAETSITIDGVVYVVDCGLCKQDFYNPRAMVEELRVVPTSQASATQRAGRAGRTQSGECLRLFTAYTFKNELPTETIPEIMRCSMSAVVLQLKALGIHNLLQFDFIDSPSTASLERALDHLFLIGAMRQDGRLTTTGRRMAEFPLEPSLSKCLIRACALGCGRHMAMAAAILSLDSVFYNTRDPKEKKLIESAKDSLFSFGNGDVTGYVRIMEEWLRAGSQGVEFCKTHCIHPRSLMRARDVLDQILKIYDRIGLDLTESEQKHSGSIDVENLTKALLSGFFFNVSRLEADKRTYTIVRPMDTGAPATGHGAMSPDDAPTAELHPSSYLFRAGTRAGPQVMGSGSSGTGASAGEPAVLRERPSLVVFTQLRRTTKRFMMHVSAVLSPEWVLEMAPVNYFQKEELETGLRKRGRE